MQREGCLTGIFKAILAVLILMIFGGMVILLAGCGVSTTLDDRIPSEAEVSNIEDTGLYFIKTPLNAGQANMEGSMPEKNSKLFQAWNVKKKDFWTKEIDIRLLDVENYFSELLSDGYIIYDVVAENGFANLAGKAVGKYVCVWKNGEPKQLWEGGYNIRANYFTPHNNVVILGIKINSQNKIIKLLYRIYINSSYGVAYSDTDYQNKLKFKYSKIEITTSGYWYTKRSIYEGCFIYPGSNSLNRFISCEMIGNYIDCLTVTGWFQYEQEAGSAVSELSDNYFIGGSNSAVYFRLSAKLTLKNMYIKDFSQGSGNNHGDFQGVGGTQVLNFQNVIFENFKVLFLYLKSDGDNIIYIRDDMNFYSGDYSNYIFLTAPPSFETTISLDVLKNVLDLTEILDDDNFLYLSAQVSMQRKTVKGVYGTISRKYYRVQFMPNVIVYDEFKHFDTNDYLVIHRTEEETLLLGKTIKDLTLYSGAAVYSYRNDVSFLMIGKNADGDYSVFAWHKNEIAQTVFGDAPAGVEYEIVWCFQIWEPADDVEIRNYGDWDDSELEGTVVYQDVTSKAVIQ